MRMARPALILMCLVAGLSAQAGTAGKRFVRPPAGQHQPYSLAIAAGGVVYVAGQLPTDANGRLVAGDITAQARQVFDNLRDVLRRAGSSLDQAVEVTVMLQHAADLPALDRIYRQQFHRALPARTTIIGDMVRPGALLEMALTAVPNGVAREAVLPPGWVKPAGPYNYAIKAGDTLYMAGLVSRSGRDNSPVEGDIATEIRTIMDNAGEILKAGGMSYGDLAAGRVALRDMTLFAPMNEAYRAYWEKDRPARVSCQAAPPGSYGVEITFVAIKGSSPREVIVPPRPDGTPGQSGPIYSPAIRVGNRLFVSGGTGVTRENGGDMKSQTAEALTRFGAALKAAGFDYKDVVGANVYVADVQKFDQLNEGYRAFFPADPPVRATVGVGRLANPNALAEIMLTAVK